METTRSMTCEWNILSPFIGLTTVGHNAIEMTPRLQLALCPLIPELSHHSVSLGNRAAKLYYRWKCVPTLRTRGVISIA